MCVVCVQWLAPLAGVRYQVCSAVNGEDPACSDGLLLPISVFDHLNYLVSGRGASPGAVVTHSFARMQGVTMYGLC